MITCPYCLHANPETEKACLTCHTLLPIMIHCATCGAPVQADANFCGQCGSQLDDHSRVPAAGMTVNGSGAKNGDRSAVPPASASEASTNTSVLEKLKVEIQKSPAASPGRQLPLPPPPRAFRQPDATAVSGGAPHPSSSSAQHMRSSGADPTTQLQNQQAYLLHVQTNVAIELPSHLTVIHIGKPNDRVPPDIDIAGFPNSEIVSRVHADMRVEGDTYFIEDVGSANGTYINNLPLPPGNRHRLRPGDRISLGKGDLMTFLFQIQSVL